MAKCKNRPSHGQTFSYRHKIFEVRWQIAPFTKFCKARYPAEFDLLSIFSHRVNKDQSTSPSLDELAAIRKIAADPEAAKLGGIAVGRVFELAEKNAARSE